MSTRTQVCRFVLFLAVLGDGTPAPVAPTRASDPEPFYAAVGRHFQVAPAEVHRLADGGLPPEEVVVVYYLAQHSLRQPAQIVADRRAGKSWRDIAVASGLEPESFDHPHARPRAPFVNVYALYHRQPRDRWSWDRLPLRDADVVSLVNRHFLFAGQKTAQHTVSPELAAAEVRG